MRPRHPHAGRHDQAAAGHHRPGRRAPPQQRVDADGQQRAQVRKHRRLRHVHRPVAGGGQELRSGDGDAVRTALDRVLFPADELRLGPLQRAWLIQPLPLPADPPHHWRPLEGGQGFWLGNQLLLLTETEPAAGDASELQDLEPAARALLSLPRLDPQGRERLRLQWGEPAWPGEINDDTNPFELGLAPRVSLNKGCYVGQETLARLATYDGVRQQLRRWICVSDQDGEAQALALLTPGARLVSALGERAGAITSVLRLDGFTWIGLALVRRSALDQEMLVAATENPAAPPAEASEPPLVLRISRPERFCDPPVGAGGLS